MTRIKVKGIPVPFESHEQHMANMDEKEAFIKKYGWQAFFELVGLSDPVVLGKNLENPKQPQSDQNQDSGQC